MANETILVVDGDTRSRKILEVSFKKSGYRVLMTESRGEALERLQEETPDLIVSDTQLPDGDGFDFCRRVKQNPDWQTIPFLFLTEEKGLPRKIEGLEIGADDYLTRPIYIKEVTTRVEVLLNQRDRKLLSEGHVEEYQGELAEITLIDLLQAVDQEGRSGAIAFERGDRDGQITFRGGEIIDASCGKLQGEEAVYRLMLWPSGDFHVRYHDEVRGEDHVAKSIDELLIEGITRLQQWREIVDDVPSLDRIYETDYQKLPDLLDRVPDEVGRVVRLFDGFRSLREVIDDSPVDDVTGIRIIRRLLQEGVLEDVTPAEEDDEEAGAAEGRSHLADWLEEEVGDRGGSRRSGQTSQSDQDVEFEREESTAPGHPSLQSEDPSETQEIGRDDLATVLSRELESQEFNESDEQLDEETTGPRYMPVEESGTEPRPPMAREEDPASVDETLKELEQAERHRRREEAKRLVEQQHDEPEEEEGAGRPADSDEWRRINEEGVPRIPGATKTPASKRSDEQETAERPAVSDEPDEADEEEAAAESRSIRSDTGASEETADADDTLEGTKRRRENTPRAHPTPSVQSGERTAPDEEAVEEAEEQNKQKKGVGDTGLEPGSGSGTFSGAPVSFESVDSGSEEESQPEEAEREEPTDDARTSAERRAVSVDEAESVKDEASEAIRESARRALEEADSAAEKEQEESERQELEESGESEESGGIKDTMPFGQPPELSGAEDTETEIEDLSDEEKPVERLSTNGEVVHAEYDLGGSDEEEPREEGEATGDDFDVDSLEQDTPVSDVTEESRAKSESEKLGDEETETDTPSAKRQEAEADSEAVAEEETEASDESEEVEGSVEVAEEEQEEQETQEGEEPEEAEADDEEEGESEEEGAETASDDEEEDEDEPAPADTTDQFQHGLAWDDEPTARHIEPSDSQETEAVEESEEEVSDQEASEDEEGEEASDSAELEAKSEPETAEDEASEGSEEETDTEEEAAEAGESRESTSINWPGESSGESEESEESEDADETPSLSDSSKEQSFFNEPATAEEEEFDGWDFEEDLEEQPTRWPWAVVAVVVVGVLAAWGAQVGPFAPAGDSGGGSDGDGEPVAEAEPSTQPDDKGAAVADEEPEETVEPPKAFKEKELKPRAKTLAAGVGNVATKTAMLLGGKDPLLAGNQPDAGGDAGDAGGDTGVDAGSAEPTKVAGGKAPDKEKPSGGTSDEPSGSDDSSGSSGGGVGAEIASVRRLIRQKDYSEASTRLRELEQQAPGSDSVAKLYLELASGLQIEDRVEQAKAAYRNYLDMQPSGKTAKEVRSILNGL